MKRAAISTLAITFLYSALLATLPAQTDESETESPGTNETSKVDAGARTPGNAAKARPRDSDPKTSTADVWRIVLGILGFIGVIAGIAFGAENVAFQIRAGRWASEVEQFIYGLLPLTAPQARFLCQSLRQS